VQSRLIIRRRTPRWRRTQCLTSILGAAVLLGAVGSASVFAADPSPAPTPGTELETRADGSVWWCPPTTGDFKLGMPCRLITPPTGTVTGAVRDGGRTIIERARQIVVDAETPDESEDAAAPRSDTDVATPGQMAIIDTDFSLPATDTDPGFSQAVMDPRTAILLAVVLRAIAWGAQRREAYATR